MNPKNIKYISLAILAVIIISLSYFYFGKENPTIVDKAATSTIITETNPSNSTTPNSEGTNSGSKPVTNLSSGNTTGFHSYNNTGYNFTIKYPAYVQISSSFSTFHELGTNWRIYASPANQGKAVAALIIHSIDQGTYSAGKQSYPLYFISEVRIGVSPDIKDCYATDPGFNSQKVTNVTINGIAFKKFSTAEGATMKYIQAESYRTIHNNMCYVLEQIKSGSTYRDELMTTGVAESTLAGYYNLGETIIKTFRFTK